MYLPYYGGFYFAVAKTATQRTTWHTCKEFAGRALGKERPKRYKTITVYNGYTLHQSLAVQPLAHKANSLESHLNKVSVSFGKSNRAFKVFAVKDYPGCLNIRVPAEWCHNRIIAHLLLTHIRNELSLETTDSTHLSNAKSIIDYGKKIGLDKFNTEMRAMNESRTTLGIVNADARWRQKLAQNAVY